MRVVHARPQCGVLLPFRFELVTFPRVLCGNVWLNEWSYGSHLQRTVWHRPFLPSGQHKRDRSTQTRAASDSLCWLTMMKMPWVSVIVSFDVCTVVEVWESRGMCWM